MEMILKLTRVIHESDDVEEMTESDIIHRERKRNYRVRTVN